MKKDNVIKKLTKEGYEIVYKRIAYWDNVPCVKIIKDKGVSFLALESYIVNNKYNNFTIDYLINTTYKEIKDKINYIKNSNLGYEDYYYINIIIYDKKKKKKIIREGF